MVGAPESPALAPPRGPVVDVFYVDGGRSWISINTHQVVYRRHFLALMMGASESPALTPPRGSDIDIFYVDGRRTRISVNTHQGVRC
jgi:hypothetical protein